MAQGNAFQLRLGLVLYGGSSLAIYMSGMTQELLAMVRAAQARKVLRRSQSLVLREWAAREVETNPYCGLLEQANIDVVIDVISGTSAGGLNGIMLAKALAVGAPELGTLTDHMWRDKADMEILAKFDKDPKSVLSGDYLYDELFDLMRVIDDAGRPELGELVKVLDLFVTATDVRGHNWTRWDRFNQKLQGQSHKYLFHLKKRTRQQGQVRGAVQGDVRGYDCNDFDAPDPERGRNVDMLLAKIGRATSAFPGVFPPIQISRADGEAAGVSVLTDVGPESAKGIYFSDGGMLVNAPFEPVIDAMFERGANQPVKRVLVYLEPDPSAASAPAQTEPSMVETATASVTLPMHQDIYDQLERLQTENQRRRRLMELMRGLDGAVTRTVTGTPAATPMPPEVADALKQAAAAVEQQPFLGIRTYQQMRLNRLRQVVCDGLTRALESLQLQGEELNKAVSLLEARLSPVPETWGEEHQRQVAAFLERYDAEYHGRRLHYLLARAHEQCPPGARLRDDEAAKQLLDRLWGALEDWNNALWVVAHAGRLGPQPVRWQSLTDPLDKAMQRLAEVMKSAAGEAEKAAAAEAAVLALARYAEGVHAAAHEEIELAFASPSPFVAELRQAFHDFDVLDQILFPIELGTRRGGWGEIGLYRFCPGAANGWVTKTTGEKLCGESLGHFGAFLDSRWRENDIMWGRLDAAELIFRMVTQESNLSDAAKPKVEEFLLNRRRQILGAYPDLVDLRQLEALTQHRPAAPAPRVRELSMGQRLSGAWQLAARGQVAAGLMGAQPPAAFSIDQVPGDVLREFLMRHYKVGQEGLDTLPAGRLAGEILLMLDNTARALGKPAPSPFVGKLQQALVSIMKPLSWVARLVLLPQKGLMGMVQSNLAPLMTLVGSVLLIAWATGALTLTGGGKVLLAALFAPTIVDLLFRPTALKLTVLGVPALLTGLAALAPWLKDLAWGGPFWATLAGWTFLARVWAPFAAVFVAAVLAWRSNRKWRSQRASLRAPVPAGRSS